MFKSNRGAFQLRELQWELRDEDAQVGASNPFNKNSTYQKLVNVYIDGRYWKTMNRLKASAAAKTLRARGKTVQLT